MTELPTPPFPELHALDRIRPVLSLADLLRGAHASSLPLPAAPFPSTARAPLLSVPRFPTSEAPGVDPEPEPPSVPARDSPVANDPEETMEETLAALMADDLQSSQAHSGVNTEPPSLETGEEAAAGATDKDLAEALQPVMEGALNKALYGPENGLHIVLEPMLRSTVRRAIAEQMDSSRQFRQLGAMDRLAFRLLALFTSRTYDDIVFERTHRYQVEEAYLLRREDRSLVSYAHHDPGCHVSPRRVQERVRDLNSKLQAPDGSVESSFDLPKHRLALVREGQFSYLVAVLRGRSNALVRADLDYVLRQAEERFGARLGTKTDAFFRVLQPILEGCLLIQSPAPPH